MSKSKTPKEPSRVVSATDEDLENWFGPSRLVFGFPVRPESESQHPMTSEEVTEGDEGAETYSCPHCEQASCLTLRSFRPRYLFTSGQVCHDPTSLRSSDRAQSSKPM